MTVDLDGLEETIRPRLDFLGLEVVLIEQVTVHGHHTLRLYIDGPAGITLDDCVKVNRLLRDMPELETVTERFDFEVSSPGVERPLRRIEHFQRFLGEQVRIKLTEPMNGRKNLSGRIAAVQGERVTIEAGGATFEVRIGDIARARLVPDPAKLFAGASEQAV